MKRATFTASLLFMSMAAAVQASATETADSTRHVFTYALELGEDGRIRSLEPSSTIPVDVRPELERHIQGWVFQPAEVDGRRATIHTFLRIGVELPPAGSQALRIISATTGPTPKNVQFPEYPASAQRRGEKGVVVLKLKVAADGTVQQASQYDPGSRAARTLVDAARKAAGAWQFQPERINGEPVASTVLMPVCFMTAEPTAQTCAWNGPEAQRLTRQTVLTLDPAARLVTGLAYEGD